MGNTDEGDQAPTRAPEGTQPGRIAARASRVRARSAGVAALLSLLVPGLGQAWLGSVRRGLLLALPIITLLLIAIMASLWDPVGILDALVRPGVIGTLLVVNLGLAAYHLAAIDDTYRVGRRRSAPATATAAAASPVQRSRRSPLLVAAMVAAVGLYAGLEVIGVRAYEAASTIFVDPSAGFQIPEASFGPDETEPPGSGLETPGPVATPQPSLGPTPTPGPAWARDGRLNLLLIGSDAGPGRWLARTDTMVVLSVDAASGRAALISIPRNIVNVPLPPESAGAFPNGRFPDFLNALYVYAVGHPTQFPGETDEVRGFRAVSGAIQELVGVPLDGAVVINLNGFVDLVDAIDGLWVDIPAPLYDAHYPLPDGSGYREIYIKAGCRHLDGETALEYARSRHQDSDYGRIRRQQLVLVSLARQVDPISLLPRVGDLLDIAKDNMWTTIQPNEIAELAVLAAKVDTGDVQTIQLSPPTYPEYLDTAAIKHARKTVRTIFDAPTPDASHAPDASPRACPRH
jgi:LCP family protein required for cell wall assembly